MTRRAILACLAASIAIAAPASASRPARSAIGPGQNLTIAVRLQADGKDVVTVCQDQPIGADVKPLGESIASALSVTSSRIAGNAGSPCLEVIPAGALTGPGAQYERVFRLDTSTLRSVIAAAGYKQAALIVCTPPLTRSVRVFTGDQPAAVDGCVYGGVGWDLARQLDVQLSFTATGHDMARGIAAAVAWLLSLWTILGLAASTLGKMFRWRTRFRRALVTGTVGVLGPGFMYVWLYTARWSGLAASLQVRASIGTQGERLLIGVPALLAISLACLAAWKISRDIRRSASAEKPGAREQARDMILPYWPPAPRPSLAIFWTMVPQASLIASFLVLAATPRGDEVRLEGMLAACVVYAFLVPFFHEGLLPHVYGARLLERERAVAIVSSLREMGSHVRQIWLSPVPPAAFPFGGSIVRAGRRAIVWQHLALLEDEELAGAIALRSSRKRAWPVAATGIVFSFAFLLIARSQEGAYIPPFVVVVAAALVALTVLIDLLELIRVRTSDRSVAQAESHVRGMLVAARAGARLAAGGELGTAEIQMPSVAESIWHRAQKLATSIAEMAGLGPAAVERAAAEILATEPRPAPQPPAMPAITPPPVPAAPSPPPRAPAKRAPAKRAPAKKAAAKKTAVSKKNVAAKKKAVGAATSRARARSSPRSRP